MVPLQWDGAACFSAGLVTQRMDVVLVCRRVKAGLVFRWTESQSFLHLLLQQTLRNTDSTEILMQMTVSPRSARDGETEKLKLQPKGRRTFQHMPLLRLAECQLKNVFIGAYRMS